MPLDAVSELVGDLALDPLLKLGIIPIPQQDVIDYKRAYRRKWEATHLPLNSYNHNQWLTIRQGKKRTLRQFLSNPLENILFYGSDHTAAPAELVALAERVQQAIPEAVFSVDYFNLDPVLQVTYEFNGTKQKACLGIWDEGKIVRIVGVL
jgi:hypothetical protein